MLNFQTFCLPLSHYLSLPVPVYLSFSLTLSHSLILYLLLYVCSFFLSFFLSLSLYIYIYICAHVFFHWLFVSLCVCPTQVGSSSLSLSLSLFRALSLSLTLYLGLPYLSPFLLSSSFLGSFYCIPISLFISPLLGSSLSFSILTALVEEGTRVYNQKTCDQNSSHFTATTKYKSFSGSNPSPPNRSDPLFVV